LPRKRRTGKSKSAWASERSTKKRIAAEIIQDVRINLGGGGQSETYESSAGEAMKEKDAG